MARETAVSTDMTEEVPAGLLWPPQRLLPLGLACVLLAWVASWNMLLFHTLVELFRIIIAAAIFIIAWNARTDPGNRVVTLLGIGFLGVGGLDLWHILTFPGMSVVHPSDTNTTTQFWVAGRLLEAGLVLGTAARPTGAWLPRGGWLGIIAAGVAGVVFAVFADIFPDTFVPGSGLTPFKVGTEYLVIGLKLASIAAIVRYRPFGTPIDRAVLAYLAVTAVAEGTFTLYGDVAETTVVMGHVLKIVGYYFLYRAIVQTGIATPFTLLYRDLQQAHAGLEARVAERTGDLAHEVERRRQVEASLRRAHSTLQTLIDAAPMAVLAFDTDGKVTLWNGAAEALFGWRADEVLGHPLPTASPEHRGKQKGDVERVLQGETLRGLEATRRRKDGRTIHIRIFSAPMYDGAGRIIGAMSITADITAEKRAQQALAERDARIQALVSSVPDGILSVDRRGYVERANPAMGILLGCPADDLVGRPLDFLLPAVDERTGERPVAQGVERFFTPPGAAPLDMLLEAGNGRQHPVEVKAGRIETEGGAGFVLVVRDVSERRRALHERERLQQQLLLAQKMEALGNLAGGVAHEVNNMLVPVLTLTDLARDAMAADDPNRAKLDQVLAAAGRIREIVQQILAFSRHEQPTLQPLDLGTAIHESVTLLRRILPTSIEIGCRLPGRPTPVAGDPTQLQQVLMNLANNAAQAMADGAGRLDIRVERDGDTAAIDVADTGSGMAPETLSQIFDPFFTTKEVGEGTGLGLSVVHGVITAWGGSITAESTPGRGTLFRIRLPLLDGTDQVASVTEAANM